MNYIDHLNLFGVEAKEIPCNTGSGMPTERTVGAVGLLYMNTDNGDIYKCIAVNGNSYTWKSMEASVGSPKASIGTVELLSSNWTGSGNLYSQVVSVEGVTVTENSQVDLTPSVEQLVVFYEKDLTFVTEQENSILTVYVIGQKPENDYTIQVTITEVSV